MRGKIERDAAEVRRRDRKQVLQGGGEHVDRTRREARRSVARPVRARHRERDAPGDVSSSRFLRARGRRAGGYGRRRPRGDAGFAPRPTHERARGRTRAACLTSDRAPAPVEVVRRGDEHLDQFRSPAHGSWIHRHVQSILRVTEQENERIRRAQMEHDRSADGGHFRLGSRSRSLGFRGEALSWV